MTPIFRFSLEFVKTWMGLTLDGTIAITAIRYDARGMYVIASYPAWLEPLLQRVLPPTPVVR